jgi:hypothetical protein
MAWRLEIHHIGLNGTGDATLILAINDGVGPNQMAQVRSMLIDGGELGEHAFVNNYITATLAGLLGGVPLDVMVVTHYDIDHFNGIRGLLNLGGAWGGPNIYDNVIIFDQGYSEGSTDVSYLLYINAINLRGARARVTERVYGRAIPPPVPPPPAAGPWFAPNWLLNDEIMWTNGAGAAVTPAALLGAPPGINANPPTVTCIAANQFVQGVAGRNGGMGTDLKNEHSLGFIVQFNNFRYYIAGDLETAQENQVQLLLNPANDLAGRVVAIKTSHHGGNTSTSRAFLDRLKPDAAFISCGNANHHSHPAQEVVNVLDGYPWAAVPPAAPPPPSPHRPISYYLTGYQAIAPPPPLSYGDPDVSRVAGDPTIFPRIPGHVVLTVSTAQSQSDQRGESYVGVREAARWAARGTGVADVNAVPIGVAAANAFAGAGINSRLAAVQAAAVAAATAAGAGGGVSAAANLAATNAATGLGLGGLNYTSLTIARHTAVQTLANGGTPAQAAVAGAAAGAAFSSGERNNASQATLQALLGVGVLGLAAVMPGVNCGNAITNAAGGGLFNVSFHDYFRLPGAGPQNITHTG